MNLNARVATDILNLMTAIIGLDLGTTGIRAIAFSKNGLILAQAYEELPLIFPNPGWVEQDPVLIHKLTLDVLKKVVDQVGQDQIRGIGITNQRETTILWDKTTGKPVYNAIVWQCRRTTELCQIRSHHSATIFEKTGLRVDPYFSATKIEWVLKNIPEAQTVLRSGNLAFGTVDSWVLWHLTGRKVHATDASNASRTMLMNINTGDYDAELLKLFDIPQHILPAIKNSGDDYGFTDSNRCGFTIPIFSVLGDQQAALFAHGQFEPKTVKNTYGTGLFMMANTGNIRINDTRLISTIAWRNNGQITYAAEGSVFTGGSLIQWLRDGLGIIQTAAETDDMAKSLSSNEGVYILPALTGLGAPYWNPEIRGSIHGLTRGTTRAHIARASLESLAHQTADIMDLLKSHNLQPSALRVDGGAVGNSFLMQFQADILNLPIIKTRQTETTALGAAMMAGLTCGFWSSDALNDLNPINESILPKMLQSNRDTLRSEWSTILRSVIPS